MTFIRSLKEAHQIALFLLVVSALALGIALLSQYIGGLKPCILCIYQRIPFVLAMLMSIGAFFLTGKSLRLCLWALALVFLSNVLLSGYHVGVEQHWWAGTEECGGLIGTGAPEDIAKALLAAPVVRCDEVVWSLFGISMTGYNLLFCLVLSIIAGWGASRHR